MQELSPQEEFANLVLRLRRKGIDDQKVFAALEQTPRRLFVDPQYTDLAYSNTVIPIECGEYIERLEEQIVILSALKLEKKHRVLEIGTGSGFATALLAQLSGKVTTIERYKTLCDLARSRFQDLKLDNIVLRQMDGARIPTSAGPFDRILIWPALVEEPQTYLEMLAGSGIMLAPIGPVEGVQTLVRYARVGTRFERSDMFPLRYQPLIEGVAAAL